MASNEFELCRIDFRCLGVGGHKTKSVLECVFSGPAIMVDEALNYGRSNACATFGNHVLSQEASFKVEPLSASQCQSA